VTAGTAAFGVLDALLLLASTVMSTLALRWLNDELKLQKRVELLERDLSSGYVFAEILHLHGCEPRLEEYRAGSTLEMKVHNMEMLGQTLETLKIPFPISTRRAIMMEDRSATLQFLLQLKAFIDGGAKKHNSPRKPVVSKRDGELVKAASSSPTKGRTTPASLVLPPRDVEERFIATTVQRLRPTEVAFRKDVNMAVHLRKFEQAQWEAENELHDVRDGGFYGVDCFRVDGCLVHYCFSSKSVRRLIKIRRKQQAFTPCERTCEISGNS